MPSRIVNEYVEFGEESCGFILKSGEFIRTKNQAKDPFSNFEVSEDDVDRYESSAVASWHTHPRGTCNLSVEDYACFLAFPDLKHYIYDGQRLATYTVKDAMVILEQVKKLC